MLHPVASKPVAFADTVFLYQECNEEGNIKMHRNLLTAILLLALILCLYSCSNGQIKQSASFNEFENSTLQNENSKEKPEIDCSSLIFCKNGKYGIYAYDGTVLVPAEYDDICDGYLDV